VVGINRDKDARAVLRPLVRLAHSVWATQASGNPRALETVALAQLCRRLGAAARVAPDVSTALEEAAATTPRGLICVTGSLMLVGQARATLGLAAPEQLW
jgi:dihydrofolate synthase/folylpolyglutamate synthase